MTDSLSVAFEVMGVQCVHGCGTLIALANVEIEIAGVVVGPQGVQVRQDAAGRLTCQAPQFRAADGRSRSAVLLPDSLRDALGDEVLRAISQGCGERKPFGAFACKLAN